jgi:hypothetical protein
MFAAGKAGRIAEKLAGAEIETALTVISPGAYNLSPLHVLAISVRPRRGPLKRVRRSSA